MTVLRTQPTVVSGRQARWAPVRRRSDQLAAYLFISPALLLFLVFIALPVIGAIVLSLFQWDLLTAPKFVGLKNFRHLFQDSTVAATLWNTLRFAVISLILHLLVALGLALAVNSIASPVLQYLTRTAYFFPFIVSWAAVALIWNYLLDPNFGFVRYYLDRIGISAPNFLIDAKWALPAIAGVDTWHVVGFAFIIILAGLQGIPQHIYEAAQLDGAGSWTRLRHVTLPLLSPTLFFVIVVGVIGSAQVFEPMYIMTDGGPGDSTRSIVQYIYEIGFRKLQMGYASALALMVFVIIAVLTLAQLRLARRWVHYE